MAGRWCWLIRLGLDRLGLLTTVSPPITDITEYDFLNEVPTVTVHTYQSLTYLHCVYCCDTNVSLNNILYCNENFMQPQKEICKFLAHSI